ncbi:MAG: type II toxin-antitoxin system Phd/YefM family antitoxin [Anaerovoracaceae bacterium]
MQEKKSMKPMEHHNIGDFLRGQSSKILTSICSTDKTAFVLKNGKPIVVVMSNERYERLLKAGVDINDY